MQYDKYKEFIALDVEKYVAEYASKEHTIDDIRREIQAQMRARAQIEADIPKTIWLGLFTVTCEDVRFKLANKRYEMIQKLLEHVAELAKKQCDKIQDEFKKVWCGVVVLICVCKCVIADPPSPLSAHRSIRISRNCRMTSANWCKCANTCTACSSPSGCSANPSNRRCRPLTCWKSSNTGTLSSLICCMKAGD